VQPWQERGFQKTIGSIDTGTDFSLSFCTSRASFARSIHSANSPSLPCNSLWLCVFRGVITPAIVFRCMFHVFIVCVNLLFPSRFQSVTVPYHARSAEPILWRLSVPDRLGRRNSVPLPRSIAVPGRSTGFPAPCLSIGIPVPILLLITLLLVLVLNILSFLRL